MSRTRGSTDLTPPQILPFDMEGTMTRFYVEAIIAIDEHADEHLQTHDGVRDELTSWLSDLGAAVELVSVRSADEPNGKE